MDLINPHNIWASLYRCNHQELTSNGKALAKKIEHELVKDVIKYGKEEVFRKMMNRFASWLIEVSLFSNVLFPRP